MNLRSAKLCSIGPAERASPASRLYISIFPQLLISRDVPSLDSRLETRDSRLETRQAFGRLEQTRDSIFSDSTRLETRLLQTRLDSRLVFILESNFLVAKTKKNWKKWGVTLKNCHFYSIWQCQTRLGSTRICVRLDSTRQKVDSAHPY